VGSDRGSLLFGLEVEFGFSVCDRQGKPLENGAGLNAYLELCSQQLTHLPSDHGTRMYLANGSLLYPDVGHPELATAECSSPVALLQSLRAGEKILAEAAQALESRPDIESATLYRTNIDYSSIGTTWGCHESYLSRCLPVSYAKKVVPHLVSRVIYTGAGGFNNRTRGATFVLSPRAFHLNDTVSLDGGGRRAIFSLREDPLAERYHRVHLICGEPNCAELGTYLKIGTTALVLRMADAGIDFGMDDEWILSPLRAMLRFALDPGCRAEVQCRDGRRWTAIEMQRRYLELAEDYCGASFMPPWAQEVCSEWRKVLRDLECDPEGLVGVLDWPTKLALFKRRTRARSSLRWSSLAVWSSIARRVSEALSPADGNEGRVRSRQIKACLATKGETRRLIQNLTSMLDEHGLEWDELDAFHELRDELCELDMRYGQLYPRGIFLHLEEAGAIRRRMIEPAQIEAAIDRAPEEGRARVRGDAVRRLAGGDAHYSCDWTGIIGDNEYLDLSDPFVTEVGWQQRHAT
jgi:hypothetical protein